MREQGTRATMTRIQAMTKKMRIWMTDHTKMHILGILVVTHKNMINTDPISILRNVHFVHIWLSYFFGLFIDINNA